MVSESCEELKKVRQGIDLRPKEVRRLFNCSHGHVYRLIADGSLESYAVTRRDRERGQRLVRAASILREVERREGLRQEVAA